MILKLFLCLAVFIVTSSLPSPNQLPVSDQNMGTKRNVAVDSGNVRGDGLGPPISDEEKAAAMANHNLPITTPENHAIENSGQFQGDIILMPEQQDQMEGVVHSAQFTHKWIDGIIPYTISSVYTTRDRQVIARAMAEFETRTCLRFIGRTTETDYIEIISHSRGCWSYVGRRGGKQQLSLRQWGCVYMYIAIHEFMHAAGFWHEQSRYDRDDYVTIHFENIQDGLAYAFDKQSTSTTTDLGLEYDYASVMHYSSHAFSKNGEATISPKKAGVTLGNYAGFSELDVLGLNLLYCSEEPEVVLISGQKLTFSTEELSWNDAKEKCSSMNYSLASLKDPQAFHEYVSNKFNGEYFWLGGSDSETEGNWFWINGEPFETFPWPGNEPNNWKGNENYLSWGWEGNFNDLNGDNKHKFVCEKGSSGEENIVLISGQKLIFSTEELSWNDAKEKCSSLNYRLASLKDPQAFHEYVSNKYSGEYFWLGGSDSETEGNWFWLNGEPFEDFPWPGVEPNNWKGNENYLSWGWDENFADENGDDKFKFVCEKDRVNPTLLEPVDTILEPVDTILEPVDTILEPIVTTKPPHQCKANKKCSKKGGTCQSKQTACDGKVKNKWCSKKDGCVCCIPDTIKCEDKKEKCNIWMKKGRCDNNKYKKFMEKNCPKSCNKC